MFDTEKTQAPASDREHAERQILADRADREYQMCNGAPTMDRPMGDAEILAELFSYHPPTPHTLPKFTAINQAAKNFAEVVLQNCPRSADRSAAIRQIRDARMTANAAISLNGLSL